MQVVRKREITAQLRNKKKMKLLVMHDPQSRMLALMHC